jgi:lipopolysaccharide export system protein LptC
MINPRYVGTDKNNRPFSITADSGARSESQPGIVDLVNPYTELTQANGTWVAIKAERGRYNQDTGKLLLLGHANLFQDKGVEFVTDEVEADLKVNTAWGDRPIEGQGPFGALHAAGFRLLDKGDTIVFLGPATAWLPPRTPGVKVGP